MTVILDTVERGRERERESYTLQNRIALIIHAIKKDSNENLYLQVFIAVFFMLLLVINF